MAGDDDAVFIHELQTYELGSLPDGGVALLLAYATSAETLARGEMESFLIAITPEKARRLGQALIHQANLPPPARGPSPSH